MSPWLLGTGSGHAHLSRSPYWNMLHNFPDGCTPLKLITGGCIPLEIFCEMHLWLYWVNTTRGRIPFIPGVVKCRFYCIGLMNLNFNIVRLKFRECTCGIYPTLRPGTWWPLLPGDLPKVKIWPSSSLSRPKMHLSNVVFPHPLGPSKPYLVEADIVIM